MNKQEFEQLFNNDKSYSYDTVESVKRCFVPYERSEEAIERATNFARVSAAEAIQDVKDFFNCLKRCYSGYDYFIGDEKCDEICNWVIKKVKSKLLRRISNKELSELLYGSLRDIITDSHFLIYASGIERNFARKHIAYVTDIVVRECIEGYVVVKGNEEFPCGYRFGEGEVKEFLLPTLYVDESATGEEKYYLLGKYTLTETKEIMLSGKCIPTHRILSDMAVQEGEDRLSFKDGYAIANHKSYGMPWNRELMDEFYQEGLSCAQTEVVILNLLSNGGGSSDYPEHFYRGLSGIEENGFSGAHLPMPENVKVGVKTYDRYDCVKESDIKNTFQGKLFVVMNKGTASSAEMAVSPAFYMENAILAGSATYGCGTFGECLFYQLPNSGILFRNGHKLFWHERFEEGVGFLPDYWIDDINPVEVIEKYVAQNS